MNLSLTIWQVEQKITKRASCALLQQSTSFAHQNIRHSALAKHATL